ncbi:hypothetical protein HDU83_006356 [Entophlyctis luteolus]|nr:hypothetical protein HDU83_006356 [Entophlyctis luteolus]
MLLALARQLRPAPPLRRTGAEESESRQIRATPPGPLVSLQPHANSSSVSLVYSVPDVGCPSPRLALYGIPTVPDHKSAYRRQILRAKYAALNAELAPEDRIDVIFVYGATNDPIRQAALDNEMSTFPHDTFITARLEAMNDGKTYDWFKAARDHYGYTWHADVPGGYCPRYSYVGKTDDDTVLHIPRLSALLRTIPTRRGIFAGRMYDDPRVGILMVGMNYLFSMDIVEYLATSPAVAAKIAGVEDITTSGWLWTSGFDFAMVNFVHEFHDLIEGPNWSADVISAKSASVHFCKTDVQLRKCLLELFELGGMSHDDALRAHAANNLGVVLSDSALQEANAKIDKINRLRESIDDGEWGKIDRILRDAAKKFPR